MKKTTRSEPPADWKPPSGLCECGCGERTAIAKVTAFNRGHFKGHPLRFVHGHHARLLRGEQTSAWKGGRIYDGDGYILIRTDGRYRREHILVWEAANGPVPANRHVHHRNGIRDDNRLENLECLTRAEHKRLHQQSPDAHHSYIPDDELIAAYRLLWRRLRRPPTTTECKPENGTPNWKTYHRRFRTIARVRQLATIEHAH